MSDGNNYSYNLFYNLFMSQRGLQLPRSFACLVNDFCMQRIRCGWRKGWLNQKLPSKINNLHVFIKNAEKACLPLFLHDQGRKTSYHIKLSNHLTVLHRKFVALLQRVYSLCEKHDSQHSISSPIYNLFVKANISCPIQNLFVKANIST